MNLRLRAVLAMFLRAQWPAVAATAICRNQLVRCASAPVVFLAAGARARQLGSFCA